MAQELRRALRFETDRRERAAPLVIVLDVLVLPLFIDARRRGNLCWRFTFLCEDAGALCWTGHCKITRGLRGAKQLRHFKEDCMIGQQCQSFANKRFVPEQSIVANYHTLIGCLICGTS